MIKKTLKILKKNLKIQKKTYKNLKNLKTLKYLAMALCPPPHSTGREWIKGRYYTEFGEGRIGE